MDEIDRNLQAFEKCDRVVLAGLLVSALICVVVVAMLVL